MPQIPVYPILVTQGVNEMQSVANASGAAAESMQVPPRPVPVIRARAPIPQFRVWLYSPFIAFRACSTVSCSSGFEFRRPFCYQYEINVHALRRYQAYIYAYALVCDDDDGDDAAAAIDAATTDLERLEQLVQKMRHTKCLDILALAASITRRCVPCVRRHAGCVFHFYLQDCFFTFAILFFVCSLDRLGGARTICCKSAKDRTSMSTTWEGANALRAHHGLSADDAKVRRV